MSGPAKRETLRGYVVDTICLRRYPQGELLERAREHTRACALEGHCIESGYGLVDDSGHVALPDPQATPRVLDAVRGSEREQGIRLEVTREQRGGEMVTREVRELKEGGDQAM